MEGSKLGGPCNVPCLVALEMNPMLGGQWGSILLGGQWKVLSLVALGMFHVWLPLEGEGEISFSPLFTFYPIRFYLNLFAIDFKVLLYHGSKPLFHVFLSIFLTYKLQSCISKYQVFHTLITKLILIEDFFPFLEFMVSHMIMSYKPQAAQMNEKSPWELSLNLKLTQHPCDENPKTQEVRPHLKIECP
jgi:hypothetical protein